MINDAVVFLDSGVGGLPYLDWLKANLSNRSMVYVADNAHFPYGNRSAEDVIRYVTQISQRIFSMGTPAVLVVACNTASVVSLPALRDFSPCPVVGTVPAVKSAAVRSNGGPIGVLATQGTVDSSYLDDLATTFAPGRPLVKKAAGDIIRYVEEEWLNNPETVDRVISPAVLELKAAGVSSVVLGCTHFLHVVEPLSRAFGPEIPLIDSREGVGKRILSLLDLDRDITQSNSDSQTAEFGFFVTKDDFRANHYREFSRRHGLNWKGTI